MPASLVPSSLPMSGQIRLQKLGELRTELADMAYVLESQGRFDAADLATSLSARLAEICEERAGIPEE